jgi:hypothetical protein
VGGGLGYGDDVVSLVALAVIVGLVALVTVTGADVQQGPLEDPDDQVALVS